MYRPGHEDQGEDQAVEPDRDGPDIGQCGRYPHLYGHAAPLPNTRSKASRGVTDSPVTPLKYICCLHLKMELRSCARGRQWCGIVHYC